MGNWIYTYSQPIMEVSRYRRFVDVYKLVGDLAVGDNALFYPIRKTTWQHMFRLSCQRACAPFPFLCNSLKKKTWQQKHTDRSVAADGYVRYGKMFLLTSNASIHFVWNLIHWRCNAISPRKKKWGFFKTQISFLSDGRKWLAINFFMFSTISLNEHLELNLKVDECVSCNWISCRTQLE